MRRRCHQEDSMIKSLKIQSLGLALGLFLTAAAHAATITVTSNLDTIAVNASVTLREAITSINNGANVNADVVPVGAYGTNDTINFNILPSGGYLILPTGSSLPTIVKPVKIDGSTQGGSVQNTAVTGDNSIHHIGIGCDPLSSCIDGLTLGQGSAGSEIRFLFIDEATSGAGIRVNSANNVIAGNWIGLASNGEGAPAFANAGNGTGIFMSSAGPGTDISGNTIGGPNPQDRNTISNNTNQQLFVARFTVGGLQGGGSNIVVQNNYIGTNASGTTATLNGGSGIRMNDLLNATIGGASNALAGGLCVAPCNLIAGNSEGAFATGTGTNPTNNTGYVIQGNFFGTNLTGTAAIGLGNGTSAAAVIEIAGAGSVQIGGTAAGTGNLISGHLSRQGILIDTFAAGVGGPIAIQGNFIGTTASGNALLGNGGAGIHVNGATNVTIGGTVAGARNVIGGNGNALAPKGPGIWIEGNPGFSQATAVIQGNNIGIGADGSTNVGNIGNGIDFSSTAFGSTVGPALSGGLGGNIIAFNGAGRTNGAGIGMQNTSNTNKIFSNSIFSNTGITTGIGIDLSATSQITDGPTANDACDGDTGGNNLQNFPVLTAAGTNGASITVSGTLNSTASTTFKVEFFANSSGTQGKTFLGSTNATTNGACSGSFSAAMAQVVAPGTNITATATDPSGNTSEFSAAVAAAVTTAADSTVSGRITDTNGNPVEGVAIRLSGTQNRLTITDSNGNYHFDNVETDGLYQVTPSRPNFVFGPTQRSFTVLGQHADAVFSATFTGGTVNPLDTTEYFVRQQYVDFLGREPDEAGFNFWVNNIQSCGADAQCTGAKRIDTSAAFFLSIEFQQTGYLVYRMYQTSFGDLPGTPVPVGLNAFRLDTAQIDNGVIVNQDGWQTALEINKQTFATNFVLRGQFTSAYPTAMSPTELVNKLLANAGITISDTDRAAVIGEFGGATNTTDTSARARALRRVAENPLLAQREFDPAFVLMEYFGYLRRDPNSGPDPNFDGYDFWLAKLNQFNGDFEKAEMVKAFLVATEYRQRFPR
jgi:hypothetical protein